MPRHLVPVLVALVTLTAGCLGLGDDEPLDPADAPEDATGGVPPLEDSVTRSIQIDDRWSGEPSILALDDGTLLITGAGGFSRYVEDPTDAPGNAGQSYLWRSTDDGATWTFVDVDTPGPTDELTPYRNAVPGVEGDLSQDEGGRAYFVDLSMLATNGVSASDDTGETWTAVQSAAGLPGTDRPWITGTEEDEVYVKYLQAPTGWRVARSTDGGQTFLEEGPMPDCSQADMAWDPAAGELVVPCVDEEALSIAKTPTGEAISWETLEAPTAEGPAANVFPSLSVAGEGDYAFAYSELVDETTARVMVTTTTDGGQTWSTPVRLSTPNSTAVFPWTAANADGTVAVVWYEANGTGDPDTDEGTWYPVHARFTLGPEGSTAGNATTTRLSQAPVHEGPICTGGLGCVLDGRSEDRRLLDFFEVDVDQAGTSHVAWTSTTTDVPTIWYGQVEPPR